MEQSADWARQLAEAVGRNVHDQPLRICALCVDGLAVTGAGMSLVTETGNRGVVCATDDVAALIEDLQLTLGEGPCIEAARSGAPVLAPDLEGRTHSGRDRWPAFLEGAVAAGARALFAFPLRVGTVSVGAMDVYRDRPGDLHPQELTSLVMAADAAALAVLQLDHGQPDVFAEDAATRSAYGIQVHQATGMVKVQLDVSIDEAFLALRARAFACGRTLAEVASDVVARRVRFGRDDR